MLSALPCVRWRLCFLGRLVLMLESYLFFLCFFLVALLYASVGHGGASGYLAVMSLFAIEATILRSTALSLNVVVSLLGTVAFFRAGYFRAYLFWPLALSAIPCAYLGGSLELNEQFFRKILGLALCVAFLRLVIPVKGEVEIKRPPLWQLLVAGACMGFVSGLIGVGGGIFLTPLAIFMKWAPAKSAAAISAPFILVNSVAGLAGMSGDGIQYHPDLFWLVAAVIVAGSIGVYWGSRIAMGRQIRVALAVVLALASFKLLLF